MKRLLEALVLALLVIYPTGVFLRIRLFDNAQLVPQDIVVFLISILTYALLYRKGKLFSGNNFFKFQVIFIAIGLVSLAVNAFFYSDINIAVAMLYAFRYFTYLSLVRLGELITNFSKVRIGMFLSGGAFLIIGLIQFVEFNNLKGLFYLGWDDHLYRLFSSFLDPNFSGVFYALFFLLLIPFIVKNKFSKAYLPIIVSAGSILALFLTYSRTALLAILTSIVTLCILTKKVKILIIGFVGFLALLIIVSDTSVEGLNPLRTASTSRRLQSLKEVTYIISKQPFMGVGFNAFRDSQVRYQTRFESGVVLSNADGTTDNSFLFALATTGVFGFTFYVISYVLLIKDYYRKKSLNNYVFISLMVGLIVGSFFLNILFFTPLLTFLMLTIAALGVREYK